MSHRAFSVLLIMLFVYAAGSMYDDVEGPKEAHIDNAIRLGAQWFLNNQDNRFLHYEYFPEEQMYSDSHHSLRETGALWSIAEYAECTGSPSLGALRDRGLAYFEEYLVYDPEADVLILNRTPSSVKLGYSAFMILSFLKSDHENRDHYMEKLANGIMHLQREDGSFYTYFDTTEVQSEDFYPGEALFGLMSLYEENADEEILESVAAAYPYYRAYWDESANTAFTAWQMRAYAKYARASKQEVSRQEAADFVFSMADFLVDNYEPRGECINFEMRGSALPVHLEGMVQAYQLARDVDDVRAECYGNFVREAVDFTLSSQITDYSEGSPGLGAFRTGSASFRVDRNQHAIVALMDACTTDLYDCGICS